MDYQEAMARLMGMFGELVMVYIGPPAGTYNVAVMVGALQKGQHMGEIKSDDPHADFREGNTFFWVGRHPTNGFFVAEDKFVTADLDDEGAVRIEQSGGVQLIVEAIDPAPIEAG